MAKACDTGSVWQKALQFDAGKRRRATHCHQTFRVGADPIIELAPELVGFVELHYRVFGYRISLRPGDHERLYGRQLFGESANSLESQERVLQVIEYALKQDDIEGADLSGEEFIKIQNPVIDFRTQLPMNVSEAFIVPAINEHHFGSTPFHFEAEPAIPGADIEDPLATQVFGNGELRQPQFQCGKRGDTFYNASVRQLETVPPSLLGEFAAPTP